MTHLSVRATRAATLAVAAALLGACQSDLGSPTPKPIGVLQVTADGDISATTTRPTVTFIRAFGLSIGDSRNAGDTCEVLSFNETSGTPEPVPGVAAGEAISFSLSGTTTQLVPTDQTIGRVYAPAALGSVTFTPGDSAKITVPGSAGGFPATTFALRTAEPIIWVDSIRVATAGSTADMTVKWNAGDANSAMLLSLRYDIPTSSNVQQVLCIMKDDGEFAIPGSKLAGWQATTTTERRAVATRVRNSGVALEGGAVMYGSASFRKSVPVAAP